jgi:hypothetical protein
MEKSKHGSNDKSITTIGGKPFIAELSKNPYYDYLESKGAREKGGVLYISFYASVLGVGAAVFLPVFLQNFQLPREGRIRAVQFSSSFKASAGGGPFVMANTLLTIYQNFNPYYKADGTGVQNTNGQYNIWKSSNEGTKRIEFAGPGLYCAPGVPINVTMSIHNTIALNDTCTGDCVLEVEL